MGKGRDHPPRSEAGSERGRYNVDSLLPTVFQILVILGQLIEVGIQVIWRRRMVGQRILPNFRTYSSRVLPGSVD